VLAAAGVHAAGLHLETTPDALTECVDDDEELAGGMPVFRRYESACDPRLNPGQARAVIQAFTDGVGS
jgi:3-deoxy-7-phosphoheptulonate synthase